ncbi:MAG TPA: serine protease [Kutzneria sp.]
MSIDAEPAAGRSSDAEPWRLRLKDSRGTVLGAGIALTGGAVVTCAHVVTKAADYGENVEIIAEWVELGASRTAKVVPGCWAPTLTGGGADIALLRTVEPTDLPGATLHRVPSPRNRTVHAFGFPAEHDFGIWASAVLAGTGGPDCEWIQLDHTERSDRIRPGFSGAAALDDISGAVVGMVVTTYRDQESKLAWIIPVDTLRRHVPAIDRWVGEDVAADGWRQTIGLLVIQYGSLDAGRIVDASGKSTAELSQAIRPVDKDLSVGFAGIDQAQQPEQVLADVVAPLVRQGATVVLRFDDDSSPSAILAKQWQLDALQQRVDELARGVEELAAHEGRARRRRAMIRARFTPRPDLADIPALAAELELPLAILRSSVRDQEASRLARALHRYERELVAGLDAVRQADEENDEALRDFELLRGLLISYNAKAVEHGLMEDGPLAEMYRAALAALDAHPCVPKTAHQRVHAYVAEVRRRT